MLSDRGDGLIVDRDGVGHVDLGALARDKILFRAALARHLVDEGDGLCLSGEEVIVVDALGELQELFRAAHGQLRVAEHDESTDIKIVRYLADGKVAVKTRDMHRISRHKRKLPSRFTSFSAVSRGKQDLVYLFCADCQAVRPRYRPRAG